MEIGLICFLIIAIGNILGVLGFLYAVSVTEMD